MEISKRSRTPPLEVLELIQIIQSLLPAKEAARTMVLSKSWLHAWSTSPTLRICVTRDPFTLPDEILSRENASTISVKVDTWRDNFLWVPVIRCVSLRVLELLDVCISQDVLDNLLSTCTLLEKINIVFCNRLETIKVRRLFCLRELKITSPREKCKLEIDDVPSLSSFVYKSRFVYKRDHPALMSDSIGRYGGQLLYPCKALAFNSDSFESMKQLCLSGVIMNRTLLDMINSKFPFLESLTIEMECSWLYRVDITCVSLKRLILMLKQKKEIVVPVYAKELLSFRYKGTQMPSLLFPTGAPQEIEIKLNLRNRIYTPFFFQMREALNVSSKFNIKIVNMSKDCALPCNIDVNDLVDYLKRRLMFPATNVDEISFEGFLSNHPWEHSSLFDAFISICHPNYVKVPSINSNYYWKLIAEAMIKWRTSQSDLKDVEIKNGHGRWETLRYDRISSLDDIVVNPCSAMFKLNWCSP